MRKCKYDFEIPNELKGEDVYDMLFVFDNENEAIEYVVNTYTIDKTKLIEELYEENKMRNEFGKENYLRSASVSNDISINELMSGEYILWMAY